MRGIVGLTLVVGLIAGAATATAAAPKEPCSDIKVAQARAVLGPTASLSQKKVIRETICTAKVGGSVAATIRSQSSKDFDYVVAGLKDEKVYVKGLKQVSLGGKGYAYDLYAGSPPAFTQRVLLFQAGQRMFSIEVPAKRLVTPAKQLTLARDVLKTAPKR
jgi:hypothetical protein